MKSPLKTFFFFAIVFFLVGFISDNSRTFIIQYITTNLSWNQSGEFELAHFYIISGRFDKAIEEYKSIIDSSPDQSSTDPRLTLAKQELNSLVLFQNSPINLYVEYLAYFVWFFPPKMYGIAIFLFICWIFILAARKLQKKQLLFFYNFEDYADTKVGSNLSKILVDRIHEILWRIRNATTSTNFLTENLELPVIGMVSEGSTFDAISALETAFIFSTGIDNLPLSKLLTSILVWFQQPEYLVRGVIESIDEKIKVKVMLIENDNNLVKHSWCSYLSKKCSQSEVIDAIIYPLLFHFSHNVKASYWDALKELHLGIEDFLLYKEQPFDYIDHFRRAQQHIELAIKLDPLYEIAVYDYGLFLLVSGDYEKARMLFNEVAINTKDEMLKRMSLYNYGVSLYQLSQDWSNIRASEVFNDLLSKNVLDDEREQEFDNLVRSSLANTYARIAFREQKDPQKFMDLALAEADKVLRTPRIPPKARANAYAAKAYVFLAQKNYDSSISIFKQALLQDEDSVVCWLGLGEAYLAKDLKTDALIAFQSAARLTPFGGYANYKLGNYYRKIGDLETAAYFFQRASGLAISRVSLGKIYLSIGQLDDALNEFRQATKLNAHMSDAWVNIAWVILEMENEQLYSEAELSARRSIQLEKNPSQVWHRYAVLSRCLLAMNKNDSAYKAAIKAVEQPHKHAQAYYYLALAQYRLDLEKQSLCNIEKTIELDDEKNEWRQLALDLKSRLLESIPDK